MATRKKRRRNRRRKEEQIYFKMSDNEGMESTKSSKINFYHIDPFDSNIIKWNTWRIKFQACLQISNIENDKLKVALLISNLNGQALETLINICKPRSPSDFSVEELLLKLDENFKDVSFTISERCKFFKMTQDTDNLNTFALKLKQQAEKCQFPTDFYEEALITSFVMNISSSDVRTVLLQKEFKTLNEAVELARTLTGALEISKVQPTLSEVNKISEKKIKSKNFQSNSPQTSKNSNTNSKTFKCRNCGMIHGINECPAYGKECHFCKKLHHFSKYCRSKQSHSEDKDSSHYVTDIFNICDEQTERIRLFVNINGQNKPTEFELDCGSKNTILSKSSWIACGKFPLQKSNAILYSYSGHKIKVLGEAEVEATWRGVTKKLPVVVAQAPNEKNLLGLKWNKPLLNLNLDKFNCLSVADEQEKEINMLQNNAKLQQILKKFSKLFQDGIGHCKDMEVKLRLKENVSPVFCRARVVPFALREPLKHELDRLESLDIIKPIRYSEYAAPIVVVRKPNNKIRICADFSTGLNERLEVYQYPLPVIEDLFTKVNGAEVFSKLDISEAYYSLPVDEETQKLLVINTPFGLYSFKRLAFGINSGPMIYQEKMEIILQGIEGVACLLDDIIISGNEEQHFQRLQLVLERLQTAGLRLNKSKCEFLRSRVEYLGYVIEKSGLRPSPNKIKAIQEMPEPTNIKELEAFIGMINYYGKFIKDFSDICAPLNQLRKKDMPFQWNSTCKEAFKKLTTALTEDSILAHYDPKLPLVLAADASSKGVGISLLHRFPDGTERPVMYGSKTLNPAEQKYSQIEREGLAIVYGIKKFHKFLWGRKFILQTDCRPLMHILNSKKGIPQTIANRLQRWSLVLMNYSFTVEYVPTSKFGKVDGLSRLPMPYLEQTDFAFEEVVSKIFDDNINSLPIQSKEIAKETAKDPLLLKVHDFILTGWPEKCSEQFLPYFRIRHELTTYDGCIVWGIRVVIPPSLRKQLLSSLHETHVGIVRSKALARGKFWWPKLDQDIEENIKSCEICNKYANQEPMESIPWPASGHPWDRIHLDFAGPFQGKMLLLVVDAFSKWIEVFVVNNMTSETIIYLLKTQLITRFGLPRTMVTDNQTTFTSSEFQQFCANFGIKHILTPSYHPQSNGQVERYVQTTKQSLRKLMETGKNINQELCNFLFQFRSTPTAAGVSPAELFLRRKLRTKLDIMNPLKAYTPGSTEVSEKYFKEGQPVWVKDGRNPTWKKGCIRHSCGRNTYILESGEKKHNSQLRPFMVPNLPSPVNIPGSPSSANSAPAKFQTPTSEELAGQSALNRPQRICKAPRRLTYSPF